MGKKISSLVMGLCWLGLLGLTACGGGGGSGSGPSTGSSSSGSGTSQIACSDLAGCVQISNGFQFPDGAGGTITCVNGKCSGTNPYVTKETADDGTVTYKTDTDAAYNAGYSSGLADGTNHANQSYNNGYNSGFSDGEGTYSSQINTNYNNGYNAGYTDGKNSTNSQVGPAYNNGYNNGYNDGASNAQNTAYNNGYAAGSSGSYNTGYNSGYNNGWDNGYNDGYNSNYGVGLNDGYDSGYSDGYSSGYGDGYYDGSYGYSVIGGTKDTDLQKAQAQQASLEDRANAIAQNIGMSVDSARQMVQLSDQVRQMATAGQMTSADRMAIANSALKIAGVTTDEVNTAISQAMKGNLKSANDLMEKAAKNMGMASSSDLRDKLLPNVGLVMP